MNRNSKLRCAKFLRIMRTVSIAAFLSQYCEAFEEPAVNLGASSFFDGMAVINLETEKAAGGFYFNQYLQYYRADHFNNAQANPIPGTPRLEAFTSLTQLIYLFDKPNVLGGHFGIDALIPIVRLDTTPSAPPFNANNNVLGDLTIGPAFQFDPIMMNVGTNRVPVFMHRIDLDVFVPVGDYNPTAAINPGANFLSFNPYWAATLFLGPKVVTSWRIHYLLNDEDSKPNLFLYPPGTKTVRAGDAVHLNFDTAIDLYQQHLYAGFNGYYFKQIADTEINGFKIPGLREQVLGVGPGLGYIFNQNFKVFVNAYWETQVENRPSGFRLNALFAAHF
jgi:hypothetical protein